MTSLLVFKEYLKKFYGSYEVFITPILKLLIAALMCSFLPVGFILFFAALFILLHLYALALEVAVVALALFMVMFLMYFRFSPKDTLVVLLTPICFMQWDWSEHLRLRCL